MSRRQTEHIDEETFKQKILEKVLQHGGEFSFKETQFKGVWNIRKIKAVEFTKDIDDSHTSDEWNSYVDEINNAIGVKTYCEHIHGYEKKNNNYQIIGILAYFNGRNSEIKTKHFHNYEELYNLIIENYTCCGKCGAEVILNRKPKNLNEHCHSCGVYFLSSDKFTLVSKSELKDFDISVSKKELIDCIKNLMGVFDTPIARRRFTNNIIDEIRENGREILNRISAYEKNSLNNYENY
jgi:hypothetical protein